MPANKKNFLPHLRGYGVRRVRLLAKYTVAWQFEGEHDKSQLQVFDTRKEAEKLVADLYNRVDKSGARMLVPPTISTLQGS